MTYHYSKALMTWFFLLFFPWIAVAQEQLSADHVKIRVVAPQSFQEGTETTVGILFEPDPEWHVYWKNSGDSGAAPKFALGSPNAVVGPILWPTPKRLPVAHLVNLGYEGAVAYMFTVKPTGSGTLHLEINLEWLVCKEDCIPGFGDLVLKRPVNDQPTRWVADELKIIETFRKSVPSDSESAPYQLEIFQNTSDSLGVRFAKVADRDFKELDIFPVDQGYLSPAAPAKDEKNKHVIFKKNLAMQLPSDLSFVITTPSGVWEFSNVEVKNRTKLPDQTFNFVQLMIVLFSAVLGGLILNLMPCVFPVISIKAFSLLKSHGKERIKDCLLYSLGVLTTFSILGLFFLALKQAGSAIGWGFQLQSPVVILILIVLFWTMALNFLGAFEFGSGIMNFAGKQSKWSSSFGTGVLSVFIAAPCTGPFMGTALGAAATVSAFSAFLIFFCLGIGLALPFLIFAVAPRTLAWLPKPGAWMETLKQFFSFPLFATVIWLLWVLGQQTGTQGWMVASIALLTISFAIWLGDTSKGWKTLMAWLLALSVLFWAGSQLNRYTGSQGASQQESSWLPFDEVQLAEYRSQGKAVFVDFTAAWCITCQVNKQAVLDTQAGQNLFKKHNVILMRADWTQYDARITKALASLGRNSVPVYAFYASDGSGVKLLPQILTLSIIEDAIKNP